MDTFIGNLTSRLRSLWDKTPQPTAQRSYRCQCGRPVFFRNSQCLACGTQLGYDVDAGRVVAIEPVPPVAPAVAAAADHHGEWRRYGDAASPLFRRCANFETAAGCNWLLPVRLIAEGDDGLCVACKLNRTIPDQSIPENRELWSRVELAKRRLVSSLIALGLPVLSKESADPQRGLAFDFLRALPGEPPVMTGHASGIITINVEEADDSRREQIRAAMREPYRTLLGHFRHEVGHYYWDRLVWNTPWLEPYRALFGDERIDYAAALRNHYENGPPDDWAKRYVSSYASTHPWEDWAESWAHYLHMVDTMDTALSFGLDASDVELDHEAYTAADLWQPQSKNAPEFLGFLNSWIRITSVITELTRSMGQPDFYPFALPRTAIAKLHFIHSVVNAERGA